MLGRMRKQQRSMALVQFRSVQAMQEAQRNSHLPELPMQVIRAKKPFCRLSPCPAAFFIKGDVLPLASPQDVERVLHLSHPAGRLAQHACVLSH